MKSPVAFASSLVLAALMAGSVHAAEAAAYRSPNEAGLMAAGCASLAARSFGMPYKSICEAQAEEKTETSLLEIDVE